MAAIGHSMSTGQVHRLMKAAGLQGRHPKAWKKTTVRGEKPVNAPDRIGRNFTAPRANEKWCGDITYVKTWDGWAYMATGIDLHSRAIVGYAIDDHMRTSLVTDALDMAVTNRKPSKDVIFHSDRGSSTHHMNSLSTVSIITYSGPSERLESATTMQCRIDVRDVQEGTDPHPSLARS